MIKKIDILILIVISLLIVGTMTSNYNEFTSEKELFSKSINEIKKNTISEYKDRLKNSINTTIIILDSTYNRIIKNHKHLMNLQIDNILKELKNFDKKTIYDYIANYENIFFKLTIEKTNGIIYKQVKINDILFYIYVDNKRIDKIFEDAIRDYLYKNITNNNIYTWINKIIDFKGGDNYAIRLIHPNLKNTEGKLLSTSIEDVKGNKPYLEELNGINKNKEIYFKYNFKLLNSNKIAEKLSYAKLYEKNNWIIATGMPLSDLDEHINKRNKETKDSFEKHIYETIIYQVIVLILFIILLLFLRNKIIQYFKEVQKLENVLSKKLDTTEKQAESFFNLSINLQLITDFDGKIIQISNSSKYILGYSPDELINTSFLDLVHPDDKDNTINEMKDLIKGKVVYYFENSYKHKDGHYIILAWSANSNEERTLIYASAHDKTKLRNKEQIIFQQSKMASMGEMLENIAHQWRQPLSIISTLATSIKLTNELEMLDKNELTKSCQHINSNAQHLSQTINDFKNFFNNTKKQNEFNISNCLDKTLRLIESQFKAEEITIKKDIEVITYYGLENEFIQMLINIINNARDELIKQDKINRVILINVTKKEDSIEVTITDNAGGIKDDILPKIFESHFTTKEKTKGTGIGLYMSKMIIEEHMHGKISAKNISFSYNNISYKGAEFCIKLPLTSKVGNR